MPDKQRSLRVKTQAAPTVRPAAEPVRVPVEHAPGEHDLRSSRLLLRPLLEADRDAFTNALAESRHHLDQMLPLHEPGWTDDDVFDRHLAWATEGVARGTAVRRALFNDYGAFIGCCNLIKIDRALERCAEITVWIAKRHLRRGYAIEALTASLDDAFGDLPLGLGLHAVSGWVRPENDASLALTQRLGFIRSGDPDQQMRVAGAWKLHSRFAITVDQWALSRPAA